MSYAQDPSSNYYGGGFAAMAAADERASFITKTYFHLAGAIAVFAGLDAIMLTTDFPRQFAELVRFNRFVWLGVLGAFFVVSMVAEKWARSAVSPAMQYAGLGLYVLAESVIFAPLLYFANHSIRR